MSLISVIIPAKNEAVNIGATIDGIRQEFEKHQFDFEIVIVNDGSTDRMEEVIAEYSQKDPRVRLVRNQPPFGFGHAIKKGLDRFKGDIAIIAMADSSDDPKDMVKYVEKIREGYDCCFGTRWHKDARVIGYPGFKLVLNRVVNGFINILFGLKYNDVTNAFKCFSREAVNGIRPVLSRHFNITVELPLKAIVRGYSFAVIPTHWYNKRKGPSSLRLQEMGSRYLFIIIYVFLERLLCGGDYQKGEIRKRVKPNEEKPVE
ncbi:MAG: glycosyltransferase family 2 protein [Candidatus Omnitrophota bacterium]